ncbi:MAG: hypothetical protein FWG42_07310 [Clostridiales bacterium]|nr:hypothetical protein [Clostridiales bacterium]
MKHRSKILCVLLALVIMLPTSSSLAVFAEEPFDADVTAVEAVATASGAAAEGSWAIELADWKIAPEDAISFAPWKTAGVGNASAQAVSTANWIPARAPGTVLGNLLDAGLYDDIFDANNEGEKDVFFDGNMRHIPRDDFAGWWWYSIDFDVPAEQIGKNFNLNLDQINYQGEIFINGVQVYNKNTNITDVRELQNKTGTGASVGAGSNPLPPYSFNTNNIGLLDNTAPGVNFGRPIGSPTGQVAYTNNGEAGGHFSSVAQYGNDDFENYKNLFIGAFRTYNVDITNHLQAGSNNIKIRVKRSFNVVDFGPNWHNWFPAASDNSMGLNGQVTLKATGAVRLDNPMAASKVLESTVTPEGNGAANLSLYVDVTNMTDAPVDANIVGVVKDPGGAVVPGGNFSVPVTVPAGYYNWDVPVAEDFLVADAQLWWTLGVGKQPLYTVEYAISVDGALSDTLLHRFGIREISQEFNNYANANNAFAVQVYVNHHPIVMKGGGVSVLDMFYRTDDLDNRNFMEVVKSMGHNFWRDEGKFFSKSIYDLMDEAGILLMTGFMCCDRNETSRVNSNTIDASMNSSAERMIIYETVYSQMRIMRQHAASWSFLTGGDYPKSQSASATNTSPADIERKMLEIAGRVRWHQIGAMLGSAVDQNSNLVGAHSGTAMDYGYDTVPPGQIFTAVNPNDSAVINATNRGMQGFISEGLGGMGIPVLESIRKMVPEENLWPYNEGNGGVLGDGPGNYNKWNYHNVRGNAFGNLDVSNLFIENAYGASETIEEYSIRAQMYQYESQRALYEALNLRRYNKAMGFVSWMLNGSRPTFTRNQFDFYFNPHGVTYGSAKGNEPVHIMYDAYDRRVIAMNNTREAINGVTATLKIYDIYGNQINDTLESKFDFEPDGVSGWSGATNVVMRLNSFIPTKRNGTDWFLERFEAHNNQYATGATGRRAQGAAGNVVPWVNNDIIGSLIRPTTDVYFMSLELKQGDKVLSRNDYTVPRKRDVIGNASAGDRYQVSQSSDLKQLNELPFVDLQIARNPGMLVDGDKIREQTVTITNPTGNIAYGIELKAYKDASKAEMTPVNYSDNLITLFPGETRTVTIRHIVDNLGGKDAYIGVECYNNIINRKPTRSGNIYVPGDPDSAEWAAWGLPAQTQTSATTNIARNVGSTVATVASNATAPNTAGTDANNRATRITNNNFVTYANQRSRTVIDGSIADGANNSNGGTGFATILPGSASYINLGSAKTFDRIVTYWTEDNNSSWSYAVTGRSVPNLVTVQISAATGAVADWGDLLYNEVIDNTKARAMNVDVLLDKEYTARHIRMIPEGITGASDAYGAQNASEWSNIWPQGWDAKGGRLFDIIWERPVRNQFSLSSVEIYHTYNHLDVEFVGSDSLKATVNGKAIAATDAPVNKTAYAFCGDKINIELGSKAYVYLDMVDVNDKVVVTDGKYTLELDAIDGPAVLTISDAPINAVTLHTDEVSYYGNDVCYTVSLAGAIDVLAVELEFVIDGDMLAGKGFEGLNGFDSMNGILWTFAGGNTWKGTLTLALPSGSTTGLTSAAPVDIGKFFFVAKGFGNAAMSLTSARIVYLDGTTKYVKPTIETGAATTIIARSKYDLNRDGVVDALDLGIMLLYCGFDADSQSWDALIKVNDAWGNGVTARMCDVNEDGMIDMLDLLDLFIHYTK